MSKKLGIIATDIEMKNAIERLFPDEMATGEFMVEILDKNEVALQGKKLEAQGARVIIGRSGSYDQSVGQVSVPLLRLKVTSLDIVKAMMQALELGETIALIIWDGICFDTSILSLFSNKVSLYTFNHGDEIEAVYQKAVEECPKSILVGGGVVCNLARKDGVPSVFVNASSESIVEVVEHAKEVIEHLNSKDYQQELLGKTLNNVRDAVVMIDEQGQVLMFNKRAESILKVGSPRIMGKTLYKVLPKLAFLMDDLKEQREKKDELLWLDTLVISYNTSLIWYDNDIKGLLMTFQDTTRLQNLEQNIRRKLSKKGLIAKYDFSNIIYQSAVMEDMIHKAKIIGKSNSTVVLYGESGTGKEILAQSLHNVSDRKNAPFVAINCAALSETLLESELFGYEEGAFTGARKGGKPGLFELAHGGTIFLDEINSISNSLQGKLLRVLEEKEVMRLGSDYIIPLDVRIICAANEDLKGLASEGLFRSDLFYRLSSLELVIPPLRERKEDIEPLFIHFLRELEKDESIRWPTEDELHKLISYNWPGNIRELRNMAKRYMLFDEIELYGFDEDLTVTCGDDSINLKEINKLVEERIISQLLKSGLSKNEIASKLGVSRATLWNKINKDV
ncbi:MAG: sigma 54-interacting transcriptional regulator [Clostridia bacterium]|nr:sigma 54-interacting transcriptional regulator [Clostridia bacterium]